MKDELVVQPGITIPSNELEITTSRAGGPGGQHVNKTNSRITVRWNLRQTQALSDIQRERVATALQHELTNEGDIIIHSSSSRSQQHNKKTALDQLAYKIRKALVVAKKRIKSNIPRQIQAARLQEKKMRSVVKKMRRSDFGDE